MSKDKVIVTSGNLSYKSMNLYLHVNEFTCIWFTKTQMAQ